MNQISPVMQLHMRYNKLGWLILPWGILLSSFVINLIIGVTTHPKNGFTTGGLSSIFVYMFVIGIAILKQTFPFSLGLSIRRKDYYIGTLLVSLIVSFVSALVLAFLSFIENNLTDGWGYKIHFFSLLSFYNNNIIWQFGFLFILLIQVFLLGFVISSLYYLIGRNGMYVFFTVLGLIFTILSYSCTYFHWWTSIFHWVSHNPNLVGLIIILIDIVYASVSYLLLQKATV